MDTRMKEALFAGFFVIIGAIIGPFITSWLTNDPPVIAELSPDFLSPQPYETSITWIAFARDPNNDPVDYKFQLKGPSSENKWKDQQNWSQKNSWTWEVVSRNCCNFIDALYPSKSLVFVH